MRRVVITGCGFVSSLALDREGTWAAMLEGRHGIRRQTKLDLPLEPAQMAGEVDLPEGAGASRRATFCERMARVAMAEALGTTPGLRGLDPRRAGVFQGAATSGMPIAETYLQARMAGAWPGATEALYQTPAAVTDVLALELGALGPRGTVMTACSSSLLAIGQAFERIAGGELDLALAGAAEGLCRTTYAGFSSLKAMDVEPCRPFSRDRAGLNLGEGENAAWKRRNQAAHGVPIAEGDELAAIRDMKLLKGLFNRMLLKITSAADQYVDYTSPNHPYRLLDEAPPV